VPAFALAAPCCWLPAPVVFGLNPVGQLTITNGEDGVRLWLKVSGPVTEDIMVFGQAPCSAGRMKRRNVAYLGLLPAPQDGISDITDMYIAKYGEPRAGEKVFIVTRQQQDGWEGDDLVTNEIVPVNTAEQQARDTAALPLPVYMYKGGTRDAQGNGSQAAPGQQASSTGEVSLPANSQSPILPVARTGEGVDAGLESDAGRHFPEESKGNAEDRG